MLLIPVIMQRSGCRRTAKGLGGHDPAHLSPRRGVGMGTSRRTRSAEKCYTQVSRACRPSTIVNDIRPPSPSRLLPASDILVSNIVAVIVSVISMTVFPCPQWYGHVLRKEDGDWVKKYMEHEVEGSRPRGRPKRTWRDIAKKTVKHTN